MPYDPEDISTIDALIGYSCVNERGAGEFKLPGYFRGVSSEIIYDYSFIVVRDERGRGLANVTVRAKNVFDDEIIDTTSEDGSVLIPLGQLREIEIIKNKVRDFIIYTQDQINFDLVLDMPKAFNWRNNANT